MDSMNVEKLSVAITVSQASRLRALSRSNAAGKRRFVRRVGSRIGVRRARLAVPTLAPRRWPTIEAVVAAALVERLAEADLAGPWEPLSDAEVAETKLSGRWPGPAVGGLVMRNYALPSDLVTRLRCASFRVSAEPLRELYARGLVGEEALSLLTDAQMDLRNELVDRLHSPGRIVRQALARYGPRSAA
jgi:hypothetical protein